MFGYLNVIIFCMIDILKDVFWCYLLFELILNIGEKLKYCDI